MVRTASLYQVYNLASTQHDVRGVLEGMKAHGVIPCGYLGDVGVELGAELWCHCRCCCCWCCYGWRMIVAVVVVVVVVVIILYLLGG